MKDERDPEERYRSLRTAGLLSTVGLTLALSIGVGVGLGILLDQWLKTRGILVIVGSLLGIFAGFKQLIDAVIRAGRDAESKEDTADQSRRNE